MTGSDRKTRQIYKKPIVEITLILITLQILRIIAKQCLFLLFERTELNDTIFSMCAMFALTLVLIVVSYRKHVPLSVFPRNTKLLARIAYILSSAVTVFLVVSTPFITQDSSASTIILLVSSAVIVPIFEELLFRGYVWNRLSATYHSEFKTYVLSTILFAIWHLGYIDSIYLRIPNMAQIPFIMFMKVITGLCFGIALGFIRYNAKNCYASMMAHSVMNIFGR